MTMTSASRCRQTRTGARFLTGFLAAALSFAGTALAGDPPRVKSRAERTRGLSLRLDHQRLAPRVSVQMESLSSFGRAETGLSLHDHVMFEEMSATIRRRAKGVARRAIRDQLLRSIRLDRGIASVRNSVRGGAKSEDRDLDFHFGVHSMLPEVGMRYKLRSGSAMGLTIGAAGEVDFRFRVDRAGRADFSAGFDGEDTFHVGANIGF